MEELLPYYERDLSHLRHYSGDFARRFPKTAGHLLPADEHSDDPYIEQLVQAIAMLDARIGKKLGDDYLQCVEALLDVMQPHYLRPFPACSIAQFSVMAATDGKPNSHRLARGTELVSRSINGVQCRFKIAYDVTLAPLAISEARYLQAAEARDTPCARSSLACRYECRRAQGGAGVVRPTAPCGEIASYRRDG